MPHLLDGLGVVDRPSRRIPDSGRGQVVAQEASQVHDMLPPVGRVEPIRRRAEPGMELDRTVEPARRILDVSAREARVEDDCLDIGGEANGPVDVRST